MLLTKGLLNIDDLRIVRAPRRPTIGSWRLGSGHFCLHEDDVKALRVEAKHYRISPVDVAVRYEHELMTRPMHLIELRGKQWLVDAVTGQLYSTETWQCQTDPRMQVVPHD